MNSSVRKLLDWYERNRRILPWREDPSPYHVWISEIMLQQTRVEAVLGYYARFLEALPDIPALARVEEDELLKLWEGLGYYSRARNLKRAAVCIMETYGGEMPSDPSTLEKLPGIGSYTAGAVASIAFGASVPAVDGNALRIWMRKNGDRRDIAREATKRAVSDEIARILPDEPFLSGAFNQALMDLGSMICIPNGAPHCGDCPWKDDCEAHRRGEETSLPVRAPKKARRVEERTILVIEDENRVFLCKRPSKGLLAGLYELPGLDGTRSAEEVLSWCRAEGIEAVKITPLPAAKHIFTHIEWRMTGYRIRVDAFSSFFPEAHGGLLADKHEIETRYSIPSAFSNYILYIK